MKALAIKLSILLPCAVVLLGAGYYIGRLPTARAASLTLKPIRTIPLLDPSVGNDAQDKLIDFQPLRTNIDTYLNGLNLSHSFYFEYLPDGINIRNGQDNVSQAASLMKVPVVMDLYKLAEQGQLSLSSTVSVEPVDIDPDPTWGNPTHLKIGNSITLQQAAQITLKYSDNTTLNLIKGRIDPLIDDTSDAIRNLDISYTVTGPASDEQVSISAQSYSSVLKCLYFACFNTPQDSSQILGLLIGSAESDRLVAGVPKNITVAHKIGSGGSTAQSDCGIVYYPQKPYLVCLMFFNINSTANNPDPYFAHVSQMIYDYINTTSK
jgi:beta-lactamase class A